MASDPRAFIIFDYYNNSTDKILFVGKIKNSRTPLNAQDWSTKTTLPQAQWKKHLKEKIEIIIKFGRIQMKKSAGRCGGTCLKLKPISMKTLIFMSMFFTNGKKSIWMMGFECLTVTLTSIKSVGKKKSYGNGSNSVKA